MAPPFRRAAPRSPPARLRDRSSVGPRARARRRVRARRRRARTGHRRGHGRARRGQSSCRSGGRSGAALSSRSPPTDGHSSRYTRANSGSSSSVVQIRADAEPQLLAPVAGAASRVADPLLQHLVAGAGRPPPGTPPWTRTARRTCPRETRASLHRIGDGRRLVALLGDGADHRLEQLRALRPLAEQRLDVRVAGDQGRHDRGLYLMGTAPRTSEVRTGVGTCGE